MINFESMKRTGLLVLLAVVFASGKLVAQSKEHMTGPVKWMSFEEAVEKAKTQKRKIFIDVYTDWCGWCKVMDKSTFPDPEIAKLLNENFYPVKLDAEQTADINFDGHTFKYVPMGNKGVHQLASSLLNNQMSYPNFVFLDENFKMIGNIPGYRKPDEFHLYLSFIGLDYYQKTNINDYQKEYKSPYTNSAAQKN